MSYCQIVVGAPGSGKSTYCNAMQQFMKAIGREAIIVNIDPANEDVKYNCAVDITDLITVDDVMSEFGLGPNGALIYCMEWLEKNMHLLKEKLDEAVKGTEEGTTKYVLFDFPGQAEFYTHNTAIRSVVRQIQKWNYNPVAVHLADSHLCVEPSNFVSALMMSLSIMCHLELPHVNILSKIDLLSSYGQLPFRLDFYTEVLDLRFLMEHIDPHLAQEDEEADEERRIAEGYESDDDEGGQAEAPVRETPHPHQDQHLTEEQKEALHQYRVGHRRLNTAIADLVQDYSLVTFRPLSVSDKYAMHKILVAIDKANGYVFANLDMAKIELERFTQNVTEEAKQLQITEHTKKRQ